MAESKVLIPVDFDDLHDWLQSVGSGFSAAELHGAIIGGLSGAMRLSTQEWSAFGLAVMGADDRLLGDVESRKLLGELAREQLDLLAGEELLFSLFLPEDDVDIAERVDAMSHWCKGFLGGFAEAQVHQGADIQDIQDGLNKLPENVAEALQDMTAIAQASLDEAELALLEDDEDGFELMDDEPDGEALTDSEYTERDYFELVEYLRLAALTVFTEYGWVEMQDSQKASKVKNALKTAINLESSANRTLH